jgi:protein phosphatase
MPKNGLTLVAAGLTDAGKVRDHNEDAFLVSDSRRLWVVADGMGGHAAGEVASGMIVERLGKLTPPELPADFLDAVDQELVAVNGELRRYAQERKASLVGSTVVALLACNDYMACGWAGDSRAYRFHEGRLAQISRDHSMLQELMDSGEFQVQPGESHPRSNAITRAVGGEEKLFMDWAVASFEPGTQFLLCSDGLTKELSDQRIEEEFRKQLPPNQIAENLVQAALAGGGRDNVTVVVVRAE